jgi:hypothetical protein
MVVLSVWRCAEEILTPKTVSVTSVSISINFPFYNVITNLMVPSKIAPVMTSYNRPYMYMYVIGFESATHLDLYISFKVAS